MRLLRTLTLCAITIAIPSVGWAAEEEIEVLARGAIHEAYAEPSERQPVASPVVPKEPPKPIEELPPDQKPEGDNVQWIPGYWSWDEDRKDFVWVSGFWRVPPPDRTWMPGSWQQTTEGWQWTGGLWAPVQEQKADIEYLPQPPKPLDDDGANIPAPSADQVYVPGSWVYRTRYVWRPGYWCPHRTNWIWQSSHYRWTPGGYIFIDGYWDYPLANRGVLFAPCYIPPAYYAAPAYVYTPTYIVREPCLYGAFFCRRGFGSYYFGDYFAPNYASIGFTAWSGHVSATVRVGGYYDPLFTHYSVGHARDPYWGGGGLVNLYVGRYKGDYARPPVNYTQQNIVINNIRTTNVKNVNNVQMLSTLRDAPTTTNVRLAHVPEKVRREQQTQAREIRTVGVSRATQEVKLVSTSPPMKGPGGPATPRTLKVEVPKTLQPTIVAPTIEPAKPGQVIPKPDRPHTNMPPTGKIDPKGTNPDPKNPKPLPKPVDPKPLPKPVDPNPKPLPKPVDPNPKPLPKPVDPKPVDPKPLPKPVDPKPLPKPVDPKPVPKPVDPKPLPKPVDPKPVDPKPLPLPKPVDPKPLPLPKPPAPVVPKPIPTPPAPVVPKPIPTPPAPVVPKPIPTPPAPVVPKPVPMPPAPVVPKPVPVPVTPPAPVAPKPVPVTPPATTPPPTRPSPAPPATPAPKPGKPKGKG